MKTPCPVNPDHATSSFSSLQKLYCHDCAQYHPWPLKAGQLPLIAGNRATRKP